MLRFFRQLRKDTLMSEKTRKYLFYAVGEITLVVIGILIALQVNNWNEERKNRAEAVEFKERLRNDLSQDKERLQYRIQFFEKVMDFADKARIETQLTTASGPIEKWQYILAVFHAGQTWPYMPSDATYIEIKNSGLMGYIGESKIQNTLSTYYIDNPLQLNQVVGGTKEYRDYSRSLIPVVLQEYIWTECFLIEGLDLQVFDTCEPPDGQVESIEQVYEQISNDQSYIPILTRRHGTLLVRQQIQSDMTKTADVLIDLLQ